MPSFLTELLGLKKSLTSQDQVERAIAEAAQQHLAKQAKLSVAQEAILTQDLRELAKADRDRVKQLMDKRLGPLPNPINDMAGNIIVCDDYNTGERPNRVLPWLVAIALIAAGMGAGAGVGSLLLRPSGGGQATQQGSTTVNTREGFFLRLVDPNEERK